MSAMARSRARAPAVLPRRWAGIIIALAFAAMTGSAAPAHAQAGCPSNDFDQDYDCPVGPVYVIPSWGNVPWLKPEYYETIQTGDLDGDGVDELIGRDVGGVHVFMYNATLGTWRPVLTLDGADELVLGDLSDLMGWHAPQYYKTIKLVRLASSGPMSLVARAADGLIVYRFTRGPDTSFGFPTGSWGQPIIGGPFADTSNWNQPPYYETLRYGTIDATGATAVIGWGADGLYTSKWNGSQWTDPEVSKDFGDAKGYDPAELTSLRLAQIDATTTNKLLFMNADGLAAYRFVSGAGWQPMASDANGVFTQACEVLVECAYTLQTATLDTSGIPVVLAHSTGCKSGLVGAKLNAAGTTWERTFAVGPFTECGPDSFFEEWNWRTIQAADIDGDGIAEVIGRGPRGILAYGYKAGNWSKIVVNTPALSDGVWASDQSYWGAIRTAKIDGSKSALLARGSAGIRTWLYDGSTFARPTPYGFPALDTVSYRVVNDVLKLPRGVRAAYTDGTTSSVLGGYIGDLENLCVGPPKSLNPPQYAVCNPPAAPLGPKAHATDPTAAFTFTVNQLLRELTYIVAANGHFDVVRGIQSTLFSQEGVEFPSIEANLLLAEAKNASVTSNYLTLFANVLKFLGSLVGLPSLTFTGNAIAVGLSVNPLFMNSGTAKLQQEYADIAQTISNLQQQNQVTTDASKVYVAGDYGLLATVGPLVTSGIWSRLDQNGYLSGARYTFTLWVMQQLLPTVWENFQVTGCDTPTIGSLVCTPPPNGSNMSFYSDRGVDFTGILPIQDPCVDAEGNTECSWNPLPANLQTFVFGPITPECTYAPGTARAWVYPAPGSNGCSLGAAQDIFASRNGWSFTNNVLNLVQ